jgi:hypothetical protein
MVAGSYSAGLRGAALADLNRTGFYNAVDDLQARQRALAMQSAEAQAAGLQVNAEPMTGFATPQVDFGQPQRPIATPPAAQPVAPVQQTTEQRTVPIPQPKPAGLGPQGSRLGEFAKGLTGYLPQIAQPPSWYSGTNPGGNLATWLRDPLIATAEGRQSAGVTGAIGGWFLDTVPERQQRAVLQEAANWYDEHGTAFMQGNPQLVEEITKDPVKFYVENVKNVPDNLGMASDPRNPLAQVDVPVNTSRQQADAIFNQLIQVESSGNPNAVSPVGAEGLAQLMPATQADPGFGLKNITQVAQEMNLPANDPRVNVEFGKRYLTAMLDRYDGDMQAALIAYNGGYGRADAWLAAGRDDKVIPKESADYYKKVGGQPVEKMPDWAKDLPPAQQLSQEYQNVQQMRQQLRQQAQVEANNARTRMARNEQLISQARKVGDVNRLRTLLDEQDSLRSGIQETRTKLLANDQKAAASEARLAAAGALTQLTFGNVGPVEQVFSQLTGVPVRMQLRADGKVDVYYQRAGKAMRLTLSQGELANNMKQAAFGSERATAAASAAAAGTAQMEAALDIQKEVAKAKAKAAGDIATKRVEAMLAANDLGTATTTADGEIFLPPKNGRGMGYIYRPPVEQENGVMTQGQLIPVPMGSAGLNVGG